MNKQELEEVKRYLGANIINVIFMYPKKVSYEELMVWNDLSYEDKWKYVPKGLVFTGGSITDHPMLYKQINSLKYNYITIPSLLGKQIVIHSKFIRDNLKKIDLQITTLNCVLSYDSLREFKDHLTWYMVSKYQFLTEDIIREFQHYVSWEDIFKFQTLSEEFIIEFEEEIRWERVCIYQNVSENFIRRFQNNVDWCLISKFQTLSEEFINDFEDKVNWSYISAYQNLSYKFIYHNFHKLDSSLLMSNRCLSDDLKEKITEKLI